MSSEDMSEPAFLTELRALRMELEKKLTEELNAAEVVKKKK